MLCAECSRCRRRSIIGANRNQTLPEGDEPAELRLRCDLCGSRQVRIVRVGSPIEALRFTTGRS